MSFLTGNQLAAAGIVWYILLDKKHISDDPDILINIGPKQTRKGSAVE